MKLIERFARKFAQQPRPADPGQAPLLMALEPRIMFDASVGVVAQDAAAQTTADAAKDSTSSNETANAQGQGATADTGGQQGSQRHEVVFVDGQVTNTAQLLDGLSANAEVVILDPTKDGLQQMADYLKGREGLDAIHLLSHGADGSVQMGNVWLASSNLSEHREALESIGAALKADGDLMLYGCNVGEGAKGQLFIDQLAAMTGADVAASVDGTGAAALGGNWTLERSSGVIETGTLSVAGYTSLMAVNYTGGPSGTAPLLGAGSSLLRAVVGDFNNDGRADILYQEAGTGAAWNLALGNANGTFTVVSQAASPFAFVTLPDVAPNGINYHAADFDGDGDIDLLVAAATGPSLTLFRNIGSSFTAEALSGGPLNGVRSLAGDFDGNGSIDFLYQTNSNPGSPWRVMLNNGNGSFVDMLSTDSLSPFRSLALPDFNAYNFKAADVDGDGDTDLLYMVAGGQIRYFRNDNALFTEVAGGVSGLPVTSVNRVVVGDFDGDGDADVLYQTGSNGTAWRYARNDGGSFTDLAQADSPFSGVSLADMTNQQYRVGDFDGDGDLDIFVSSTTASSVYFQAGSLPKLVSATPADNALNASPSANIVLTFDQSVSKGSGNIYIVRTSDNVVVQTIAVGSSAVTGSGTTWSIDPPMDLAQGVEYAVRIDGKTFANTNGQAYKGIQDLATLNFTTASNQAPVVGNVNGDTVTYTEGSTIALLDQGSNAVVTDGDSANFSGGNLRVEITTGGTTAEDVLMVRDQGSGAGMITLTGNSIFHSGVLIGTYAGGTAGNALVISLNASATPTAVSALVQNLGYRNSNTTDPSGAARTVRVTLTDDTGTASTAATVTVNVATVNDAPVVSVTPSNPTFTEKGAAVTVFSGASINTVEAGQSVTQMVVRVSNVANGSSEKLIIDGSDVSLTAGTSLVTTNGLSVSVTVTAGTATVTLTHAGLNSAAAQGVVNGIGYRNDSQAPSDAARTVTLDSVRDSGSTANGGINTVSVGVASVVSLVAVNDAPTLSGGPYAVPTINEDTISPGVLVSTVLAGATYADADSGGLSGIAVTATTGRGTWQYSTDNTNWTNFGTVSGSGALLLSSTTYVRYVPDGANSENASFTYRAWDRTSGTASATTMRSTADATINGGTTAFSSGTAQATLAVSAVNDAPVMNPVAPVMTPLTDGSTNNAGDLVSSLVGGISDVDTGALSGIVVTGITKTYGTWQYSVNGGATWNNVGNVSNSAALMLRGTDRVRFVPDGIHSETATITFKGWDQTAGTAGLQGAKINTTLSGNATPYSTGTDTATVVVTGVNDQPVLTATPGSSSWVEGNNTTSTPVVVDPGLAISDPDSPSLTRATVTVTNYQVGQDVLGFSNNGVTMGDISASWSAANGILTLTSTGNQATLAQWQAALRSVTYTNSSDTPTVTTRTVEFQVTDDGAATSSTVTRNITITAVDDSPIITATSQTQVSEDTASVINQISISDVDSTSATVTLTVTSGSLSAITGSGVTVGGTSNALTLSGSISAINSFIAGNKLTYTTAANATADVTLSISVDTASATTANTTMTLAVTAVNDAPVATVPVSINVDEDLSTSLTGISFSDIDAGSNSVTASFSVPSGTFSAVSGNGVTVLGSGTGALSLDGSLSDINAFIAAGGVKFQTALNNTTSVLMTVSINDKGNTGGTPLSDTKTLTLHVVAVNDAPVNSVPGGQTVPQGGSLIFNGSNGNLISVDDVDIGTNHLQVTLSASNGTITLSSFANLTFSVGTGTNDVVLTFSGTKADINNALNGLTFTPTAGYNGAASLTIDTNDNGFVGTGGAKFDIDTIAITVAPLNPSVANVSVLEANGGYKVGDQLTVVVTFDKVVNVDVAGGVPRLLLETGLIDRFATYVGGSGSNVLSFTYTVQAGDVSADLDYQSTAALQLNGATIKSMSNENAVLALPTPGVSDSIAGQKAIIIDGVAPTVSNVSVPADGTYVAGQNLDFTVNYSESVMVDATGGIPRIAVTLDTGGTVYAQYLSGSGTNALVFRLTTATGQVDSNGIGLGASVQLNGGSIRDAYGNDANAGLNNVGATGNILVDAKAPVPTSIVVDGATPPTGPELNFILTFDEAVSGVDLSDFSVMGAGGASGTVLMVQQIDARTYRITVGNMSGVGSLALSLNALNSGIRDQVGNDLAVSLVSQGAAVGQVAQPQDVGDLNYRINTPQTSAVPPSVALQPQVPGFVAYDAHSPLALPSLFEVRTVGGDLLPLGTIFLGDGASAPSFIAQVFGSSAGGAASGFLGFGGGEGGVFASSTFANIFSRDIPGVSEMSVFNGGQWKQSDLNQGLRGVFGAPTFGQQLHQINEADQRHVRELAHALSQPAQIGKRA